MCMGALAIVMHSFHTHLTSHARESDVPNVDNAISLPVGALEGLERIFGV